MAGQKRGLKPSVVEGISHVMKGIGEEQCDF
jgi:hypothetical protein